MRIAVVAIGRLKVGPERELVARYRDRIVAGGRAVGITALDMVEIDESRAKRAEDRQSDEAKALAGKLPDGSAVVVLDERGRDMGSTDFAALIVRHRDAGQNVSFAIGGADGFAPSFVGPGMTTLRFGAMTLPHGLVRVLLLEQIYRATTILAGHPYHRGTLA